ncbi:MAG: hypothetical protein ACHQUB_02265 [Candidatus Saccharimonadia bacterium]
MKIRSYLLSRTLAASIGIAVLASLLAINHQPVIGIIIIGLFELGRWWRAGELELPQIQRDCWIWLSGFAVVGIITLNPVLVPQIIIGALYGFWRSYLVSGDASKQFFRLRAAGVTQALVFWAIFLSAAVWHWNVIIILILVWSSSWLISYQALNDKIDRSAGILSLTWALIAAECSWIFSLWLVNYILFNGLIIIPQPSLVLTAMGYCLAGIYVSHRRGQLSRARLVEYLMVGLVVLIIVIAGTKWNGVI